MTSRIGQNVSEVGIGLRSRHYQEILSKRPPVGWFEILTENYLGEGGPPLYHLERIREHYPITLHGVGMSLGSTDPLNRDYLRRLKRLIERFKPAWVSDHLAWISVNGRYLHELLPLPYTEETLAHIVQRVLEVQDFLGRRILLENPSSYMSFKDSQIPEPEFLRALCERADCELLLDVNNVYVSAVNSGFDAQQYILEIPGERVREIHLAGYEEHSDYLFDTHGYRVRDPVWGLYQNALEHCGPVATLIEWDNDVPAFAVLVEEAQKAQRLIASLAEVA
jgi:uncharacterized protein (UPF0276 family)